MYRVCCRLSAQESKEVSIVQGYVGACLSQLGSTYCACLTNFVSSSIQLMAWNRLWWKCLYHGNWWMRQIRALFDRELGNKHLPVYHLKSLSIGSHHLLVKGCLLGHEYPFLLNLHRPQKDERISIDDSQSWENIFSEAAKCCQVTTAHPVSTARTEVKGWLREWEAQEISNPSTIRV